MATHERSEKTALKRFMRMGVLAIAVVSLACGGRSTPVAPSPASPTSPLAAEVTLISGSVVDTAWRPLAEVKVEMIDGPQAGASTMTSAAGQFSFSGSFAGSITFRATKAGYADLLERRAVSPGPPPGGRVSIGLTLVSLVSSVDIAGNYTLTFVADSTCTDIPEELRTRTYETSIAAVGTPSIPPNTYFDVKVSGSFLINLNPGFSNRFAIGVAGHDLRIIGIDDAFPALVEQIDPRTFASIDGVGSATLGMSPASTIAAAFDGSLNYCVLKSDDSYGPAPWSPSSCGITGEMVTHSGCLSNNHHLILTRR